MGKVQEGRIAGTTSHRFVVTRKHDFAGHEQRLVSHAMACKMHGHKSIQDYYVFYFSMPQHLIDDSDPIAAKHDVSLMFHGRNPSWTGKNFGHVQVPQSLKLVKKMMPADNTYVGYDFMGVRNPPTFALLWVEFIGFVEGIQQSTMPEVWSDAG